MKTLLVAGGIGLVVSLVVTRLLITWLTRNNIGQPIREDGPQGHITKAGTPTMGGLAIVIGAVAGYVISDISNSRIITRSGLLVMAAIVGAGLVGLIDDYLKVSRERNLGLNKRAKIIGLLVVAVGFAVLTVVHTPVHTTLAISRWDQFDVDLGTVGWVVFAVLLILGSANAVNLTDGLDGLAGGSAVFAFMAFTIIGFWAFRHPATYDVVHALDLAVVAAAMTGACTGFLWWNAAPARIFMGDTGSLAIGAGLAGLALTTSTALLLVVIGGLFVMETLSVILQVTAFRLFGGRRIFRMAPIHHHFELKGWPETTVIIRFWIIAGLLTAVALGFFYADFINTGAID
ncbi:MAG: phospho-N-acetylmuramoyl-pentapeptide-transferase [Microthrixaceae bacterium]|nr:phospho-N-acetylmuramoyl-pentapeptide-transferase [Microthrixaceae bacterium]